MSVSAANGRMANLVDGSRTYVASMKLDTDFTRAIAAPTRTSRKVLAVDAMDRAQERVAETLTPKLDALKAKGLLTSYELVPHTGALIINTPEGKSAAAWDAIRGVKELGRIVRNRAVVLDDMPEANVPAATAGTPEYNVAKVNAPGVWAQGVTGKGVVVGIVDTGVNTNHEALKAKYRGTQADGSQVHDYNFYDPVGGKTVAYDDHSHGSHVTGTVMGSTADRLIGMAPDAKFIATKVFTAGGSGSTATILKGLGWMLAPTDAAGQNPDASKAPDVVSNSWGSSNGASLSYLDAWKAFEAAGIIPVVAAGNSGPRAATIGSPGSYAQSITVGATDANDAIAPFSSRGPNAIKNPDGTVVPKPDVSAPGVKVTSATKDGGYGAFSGTSMATPGVSGVIALLLEKYPQMNAEQARQILGSTAVDLGAPGRDDSFGAGRVDAVAALAAADRMFGGAPKQAVTGARAA